jgi:hypothetical protein
MAVCAVGEARLRRCGGAELGQHQEDVPLRS